MNQKTSVQAMPPMRSEVSVPGIRNDRGKLPTVTGAVGRPGLRTKPRDIGAGRARRRRLRELIDPLLEELLIGPQIRQLISAHRGKARQQCDCGAVNPPITAMLPIFRIPVIEAPLIKSKFVFPELRKPAAHLRIWADGSADPPLAGCRYLVSFSDYLPLKCGYATQSRVRNPKPGVRNHPSSDWDWL